MANPFYFWQKLLSRAELGESGNNSFKIEIIKLNQKELNFEKKSFYYILLSPIFLLIALYVYLKKKIIPNPKYNFYFFDGISKNCREIKENATRWKALDIIYNKTPENLIEKFWSNLIGFRATRNRLKMVKYYLKREIQNFLNISNEVRLISVACGSAQGVIEVIKDFREKSIKALFLDLDTSALEHSKKLAKEANVEDKIIFVNKSARELENIGKEFHPHIVEVVGFLMYRPKEKAIKLVERIYHILVPNGVLLISQDNYIPERFFLYYVVNWPIIFRSPAEFSEILIKGGFNSKYCKIIYEPLMMHGLAICRKI
jgi:SAM-dependent methyltransferase